MTREQRKRWNMSEIKFSKENYDSKLSYLNYMAGYIDVNTGWMLDKGECDSPAINDFAEIYEQLRVSVRDYVWSLDNLVESLTNAGEAIYKIDQSAQKSINGK